MKTHSIDITCVQETRKLNSDQFCSDTGDVVLLSGSGASSREWAGVGFIVSKRVQSLIVGFRPISNRLAALNLRVAGGCIALFSAYAPHNLKPLSEIVAF
jgi:exonuclease III